MRKLVLMMVFAVYAMTGFAQPHNDGKKFSPEQFMQELHSFLIREADLTQQEADAFFPVYDEMKEKERKLFKNQRKDFKALQTNEDFQKAVEEYDKIDLQLKELQQTYHKKFFKVLPAKKVFGIIRAEDKFRTQMFRKMANGNGPRKQDESRRQHPKR